MLCFRGREQPLTVPVLEQHCACSKGGEGIVFADGKIRIPIVKQRYKDPNSPSLRGP